MFTRFNLFLTLLIAPFIGFAIVMFNSNFFLTDKIDQMGESYQDLYQELALGQDEIANMGNMATGSKLMTYLTRDIILDIRNSAMREKAEYDSQKDEIDKILNASIDQQRESANVLDTMLANILGEPIGQTFGKNATIKVYSLQEAGYRGYMAKVRTHSPDAIKMLLANDQLESKGETTRQAAERSGAILAINAGGFFATDKGTIRPIGTTIIDGEVVTFSATGTSVIGFNSEGNLVGGLTESEEQIKSMEILQGASFLPTLLKNSVKQTIPADWANARHPRTLVGHFENNDILFIVIDGRRDGWSSGVTLEEAQDKLLEFKVRDAYNLDGGGSSTFYYNGEVLNKPSGGFERNVITNLIIKE